MTDCSRPTLPSSTLGPRAVVADSLGGRLTTDAGTLLFRVVAERTGLFRALDASISDPRHPILITHDPHTLIAHRVTAIALGYEDLNDHQSLRADPVLPPAAGKAPEADTALASPPTLCGLDYRIDRPTLARISEARVDQFLAASEAPPEHLVLDLDATDDRDHGRQEGGFLHGYDDHRCFLPLYVYCDDEPLAAYLRPGDIDAAKHARAVLKLLVQKLRATWPGVKVTVLADSGFCRRRLKRWCDGHGIGYILGLARNPALQRAAGEEIARAERWFRQTGQPRRLFGSLAYSAASWDRPRRVIVKAGHNAQGPNPRSVVTNVPGDPLYLYICIYIVARWRAGSRSSNSTCSPTARAATGSLRTTSGCYSARRPARWSRLCAARRRRGRSWCGRR